METVIRSTHIFHNSNQEKSIHFKIVYLCQKYTLRIDIYDENIEDDIIIKGTYDMTNTQSTKKMT